MDKSALIRFMPAMLAGFATLLLAVNFAKATPSDPRIDNTVSGVVRDFDNTPLTDVAVFYFGTGSNLGNTLTDANGIYTFTLGADTYEVSVSKIGYPAPDKKIVAVPPSHFP